MLISSVNPFIAPQPQAQRSLSEESPTPTENAPQETQTEEERTLNALQEAAAGEQQSSPFSSELTEEEEKVVRELKQIDQEVRAHEQAHKTVGGQYAGAIQYETTTGPDGREYAVAGEVPIDVSPVPNNPDATVRKMDIVIRAALAPAEPSPQDFAVARAAQTTRAQAQKEATELRELEQAEVRGENGEANTPQEFLKQLLEELQNTENLNKPQRGTLLNEDA